MSMHFSRRTNWNTQESELARAHRERIQAGLPIADLTQSNPTRCGFAYPAALLDALTNPRALGYDPQPKGLLPAREAVCEYYAAHGASLHPNQIVLTTSTSEAYSFLFRLLCDPGDEVVILQPGYPLFDFLADLDDVRLKAAPLVYENVWQIDAEGIRRAIGPATRAIVVVHPNNPTGHFTKPSEAAELAALCREFGLSLIVDEVFIDYGFGDYSFGDYGFGGSSLCAEAQSFAGGIEGVPVYVVSGLSKIAGLPQMKAAWIVCATSAVSGPEREQAPNDALNRLEVIADTFLSMNAPVQWALPRWLGGPAQIWPAIQDQIRRRTAANLAALDRALEAVTLDPANRDAARIGAERLEALMAIQRLKVEGGWYAVLRIPAIQPDEQTVLALLERGVWVHPGYFFGMPESGWLVVSLLAREAEFSNGVATMINYLGTNHGRNVTDR
jgi:aspartate/methionine/tyrosine aminotransferase